MRSGLLKRALTIQMELSDLCPLNCIMCRKKWHESSPSFGNMYAGTVNTVIESIRKMDAEVRVMLQWGGEPLVHPEAAAIISDLRNAGAEVHLYTSGVNMNENVINALCSDLPGKCMVIVSLDAANDQKWNEIKGLNRFNEVKESLESLLKKRVQMGSGPAVGVKLIAMEENILETEQFCSEWKIRLKDPMLINDPSLMISDQDAVIIVPLNRRVDSNTENIQKTFNKAWKIAGKVFGREDIEKIDYIANDGCETDLYKNDNYKNRVGCRYLWDNLTIRCNGSITTCCHDDSLTVNLGNASNGLENALSHSERIKLQQLHNDGRLSECGICSDCDQYFEIDAAQAAAWGSWKLSEIVDIFGVVAVLESLYYIVEAGYCRLRKDHFDTFATLRKLHQQSLSDEEKEKILSAAAGWLSHSEEIFDKTDFCMAMNIFSEEWPEAVKAAERLAQSCCSCKSNQFSS